MTDVIITDRPQEQENLESWRDHEGASISVLLVYPNIRGMNMLPPSMALFSALLKREGHTVGFFDATDYPNPEDANFNSDKTKEKNLNARAFDSSKLEISFVEQDLFEAFEEKVLEFKPDLLAVTVTEDMFPIGISMLKKVRHLSIPTILGGVFPTFASRLTISHPEVDMICVGEGETALVTLCERMGNGQSYDDIPGIWVKKSDGSIRKNPMDEAVDMDENPILDLSIFPEGRLYRPMQGMVMRMFPLETHRGCPYKCTYCNSPSQSDKYQKETGSRFFRKKCLDRIREEIIYFRGKMGAVAFYFWADTFLAFSPKEFDAFIEMYSEFNIPFWCQSRPETVTRERIEKLAEVGLFRMAFGVEHGNHEYRKKYLKRNVSNEKIIDNLRIVNEVGVPFSVNNILGMPFETRELTFDTIELNRRIFPDSANAYSFSPFHGTPLRDLAEKEGYIEKDLIARSITRPTMLNMPYYPPEQIEGMRRCFMLYVKLPKSRWREIEKAEKLTPEGDEIWEKLRQEVEDNYSPSAEFDKRGNFERLAMGE